jgi:hypothetical protein
MGSGRMDQRLYYRLPCFTALSATWNKKMSWNYGKALGEEARYRKKIFFWDLELIFTELHSTEEILNIWVKILI